MSEEFNEAVKESIKDEDWRTLFKTRYLEPLDESIVRVDYMIKNTPQVVYAHKELMTISRLIRGIRHRLEAIRYIKEFDPYLKADKVDDEISRIQTDQKDP